MKKASLPSLHRNQQEFSSDRIEYNRNSEDLSCIEVSFTGKHGVKITIGHLYIVYDEVGAWYYSTNHMGRDLFPPTTDFNELGVQFERHARLLELQQERTISKARKLNINNSLLKNQIVMKTKNQSQEKSTQKINQLIFIEYEKAAQNGHFITVGDSYHNTIARIHKTFNEETGKPEFTVFDHEGKEIAKGEKLWELKKDFTDNREQLLEQAHQRRIESKEKEKTEKSFEKMETAGDKKVVPQDKVEQIDEREQQLRDLREDMEEDRADIDFDR